MTIKTEPNKSKCILPLKGLSEKVLDTNLDYSNLSGNNLAVSMDKLSENIKENKVVSNVPRQPQFRISENCKKEFY